MSQHILGFSEQDTAEAVAAELEKEEFTDVRIARGTFAGKGKGGAADCEWVVHVRVDMVADDGSAVENGLRERFAALADQRGGRYDWEDA